jgi:hypothetical protein
MQTIPLLEVDPEVANHLPAEDRELARRVQLPLLELEPGRIDLSRAARPAFAGLILEGMLVQTLQVGARAGLRLLGPGDLISFGSMSRATVVTGSDLRVTTRARVACFGPEYLIANRRWPSLAARLHALATDQSDRLLAQIIICQLPRVEERLLSMLWLLAESWGRVTSSGTILPVQLTHGALGGLVGARRSTVTLALQALYARGAMIRHDDGWLLLERLSTSDARSDQAIGVPRLTPSAPVSWTTPVPLPAAPDGVDYAELRSTLHRLRSEHLAARSVVRERLAASAASRQRAAAVRDEISRQRQSRRQAPSS